jgi:hypothetical protein
MIKPGYHDLLEMEDGGIVLFGNFGLVRLDPEGNYSWYDRLDQVSGGSYPYLPAIQTIRRDNNGQRIVIGGSTRTTTFSPDGTMVDQYWLQYEDHDDRTTSWLTETAYWQAGNINNSGFWIYRTGVGGPSWLRSYNFDKFGSDTYSYHQQVLGTRDGGAFYAAAIRYLRSMAPHVGIWVIRLDQEGNNLWQYALDGGIEEDLIARETSNGGFILATASGYMADLPSSKLRLIHLNKNGDQVWDRWYGDGEHYLSPLDVIEMPGGGFLIAATSSRTTDPGYLETLLLLRADGTGRIGTCPWLEDSPLETPEPREPDTDLTGWPDPNRVQQDFITERLPDVLIEVVPAEWAFDTICE